ncbi:MAG: META domain-containing protein [Pseudomonadota bacterium]
MKSALIIALLSASACGTDLPTNASSEPNAVQPSRTDPAPQPAGDPVPSASAISGEWRVAGVRGEAVDQREGITATILPEEIHAVAGCVRWNWAFTLQAGRLTMAARPSAVPPCTRALTATEARFEAAMSAARFAVRRPDGSLVLAGPSGEVALFTQ